MPIKLTVERQTLCFDSDTIGIGRNPENQVSFPNDARIAAVHAVLRSVNGRWIVESREGGAIRIGNGRPTQFAWIKPGDVIRLTESGPEIVFEPGAVGSAGPSPISEKNSSSQSASSVPVIAASNPHAPEPARPIAPVRATAASRNDPSLKAGTVDAKSKREPSWPSKNQSANNSMSLIIPATMCAVILVVVGLIFAVRPSQTSAPLTKDSNQTAMTENKKEADANVTEVPTSTTTSTPAPNPEPPSGIAPAPTSPPRLIEPQEFLILTGIGDLTTDDRPHVISVGWLWDRRTAVVSRHVGQEIEKFEADAKQAKNSARGWVIHGTPLGIDRFVYPADCPEIALLRMKEAAQLAMSAREQWQRVNHADVEKKRMRGKAIRYISYDLLPRSDKVQESHGFPLCEYDPEQCRQNSGLAHFEVNEQHHYLKSTDTPARLERGGFLVDDDGRILGMVLLDSSIVWTDVLERSLGAR